MAPFIFFLFGSRLLLAFAVSFCQQVIFFFGYRRLDGTIVYQIMNSFFPFFQLAVERSHVKASHILRYSIFILLVCTCFLFGTLRNLLFLYSMWSGPAKRSLTPMQA